MNKQEAADFLKVNPKTIERAVNNGQLRATYVKTKYGKTPIFEQSDLEDYLKKRDAVTHSPVIERPDLPQNNALATTIDQARDIRQFDVSSFADAMAEALSRRVNLHEKLTLSIKDAVEVSGLAKKTIDDCINDGRLKTVAGYRGAKHVRRSDLDKLLDKL